MAGACHVPTGGTHCSTHTTHVRRVPSGGPERRVFKIPTATTTSKLRRTSENHARLCRLYEMGSGGRNVPWVVIVYLSLYCATQGLYDVWDEVRRASPLVAVA